MNKQRIWMFLRAWIFNFRFLQGALLCWGCYILGMLPWWYSRSYDYVFAAARELNSFAFLFVICPAIPYALRYREYRKCHMDEMILQRCSVRRYLGTMFAGTAVSGFAAMTMGTAIFLISIHILIPTAVLAYDPMESFVYPYMEDIAQNGNWFLYFGFFSLLISIAGAFWAVLALAISAWVDNLYAIFIFPILFLYAMDYACMRYGLYSLSTLMFGMYYFESRAQALGYALAAYVPMSMCCYLAFIAKGRRHCRGLT